MTHWRRSPRPRVAAMRRSKVNPRLGSFRHLPEDIDVLVKCKMFLSFPDEFDSDNLARQLAEWIVQNICARRLKGPEIALMVDYWAGSRASISDAVETVADTLGPTYTVESIKQNHARYGAGSRYFREKRRLREENDAAFEARMLAKMTDDEKARMPEELARLQKSLKEWAARNKDRYLSFKEAENDIISQSVIEDD